MATKWWTLLAVCVATFMLLLDVSIVTVALPDIARQLDASLSDLQWVVDSYALALASVVLTAGSLADRFGRRRVFLVGLSVFTLASLLCGLAGSPLQLNVFRGLQGIGGAMMFATALALLAQEFRGPDRGTAFGIWGATTGAAVAVGPLAGGALTDGLGWEWIFLVNVPIGVAAVALTLLKLRESRSPAGGRIDWAGFVVFTGALFLLVFGLIRGNEAGWTSATTLGRLGGAALLLALFVWIERRQSAPMFDLSLFRNPTFTGAAIVAFALSASVFATFLYLVLYMQNVLGYGPLEAGLRFLPITLLSFFVAPLAGRLAGRFPVRLFLGGGLLLVAIGLGLMSGLDADSEWTALLAGFVIAGIGIGLVNPPLASAAIAVVEPARSGMASGTSSTFRQVGFATGIAGLGALLQTRVQDRTLDLIAGTPAAAGGRGAEVAELVAAGATGQAVAQAPPAARELIAQAGRDAFISGLNEILLVAAAVALVGSLCAFLLVRQRDFVSQGAAEPSAAPAGAAPAAAGA